MPLYNYQCQECGFVLEKFHHHPEDEVEMVCSECECEDFERIVGFVHNRTKLNARDNLEQRLTPEVNRIMKKVSEGSDKDFLDIAGD